MVLDYPGPNAVREKEQKSERCGRKGGRKGRSLRGTPPNAGSEEGGRGPGAKESGCLDPEAHPSCQPAVKRELT